MLEPIKVFGWMLLGLSVFLMADAALAAIFKERYMRWGLNHLPAWYSRLMTKLYEDPKIVLWGLILAEFAIGALGFFYARALVTAYNPL